MATRTLDRRIVRRSIVSGVVVAVALAAAGLAYALTQQRSWTAEAVVVVLPAASLDDATSAAYYETLSRGQIVATFAEVAATNRFEQQAEAELQLSVAEQEKVSVEVTVVPDTAVILIRTTAPTAATAEAMADQITLLSSQYWAGLSKPYRTRTVGNAAGSAEPSGNSPLVLAGAAIAVALVAGLAVQQAVYHLSMAARRARGETAQESDDDSEPDAASAADGETAAPTDETADASPDDGGDNGGESESESSEGEPHAAADQDDPDRSPASAHR